MKKIIAIFIVVAIFLFIQFCIPTYDFATLTEKFNACYSEIESITDKHNLENKFWVTDESQLLNKYYIIVNDKASIDVEFSTNATETQKGNGTFFYILYNFRYK